MNRQTCMLFLLVLGAASQYAAAGGFSITYPGSCPANSACLTGGSHTDYHEVDTAFYSDFKSGNGGWFLGSMGDASVRELRTIALSGGPVVINTAGPRALGTEKQSVLAVENKNLGTVYYLDGTHANYFETLGYPLTSSAPATTYSRRPTLIMSIQGTAFCGGSSRDGLCKDEYDFWGGKPGKAVFDWQNWVLDTASSVAGGRGEVYHVILIWNTNASNADQVKQTADQVTKLLDGKGDWDIILMGHSRGGVFAHELAGRLTGQPSAHQVYTILLDTTAALPWNDTYPRREPPNVTGYQYDDGKKFVPLGLTNGATVDGRRTLGYRYTQLRNLTDNRCKQLFSDSCSHEYFPEEYIRQGYFRSDLKEIFARNHPGRNYPEWFAKLEPEEKESYWEVHAPFVHGIADVDASCNSLECFLHVNVLGLGSDIRVERSGFSVGQSLVVATASLAVSAHGIKAKGDSLLVDVGVSIDAKDPLRVETGVATAIDVDISATKGGKVRIGGYEFKW